MNQNRVSACIGVTVSSPGTSITHAHRAPDWDSSTAQSQPPRSYHWSGGPAAHAPTAQNDPDHAHRPHSDPDQTGTIFGKAYAAGASSAEVYHHRSHLHAIAGDVPRALAELDRALELDPMLADAYYLRGLLRANLRDHEQAIADLERYLLLAPDGLYCAVVIQTIHEVQIELAARIGLHAHELLRQGHVQSARDGFDAALRLSPNNADAYHGRGQTWSREGDHSRALADFTLAITLAPETAHFYRSRAQTYRAQGLSTLAAHDDATAAALSARSIG